MHLFTFASIILLTAHIDCSVISARQFTYNDYTIGWISALPIELAAAQEMLDEEHPELPQIGDDSNNYSLGRIGEHNVVIACLPAGQIGTNSAAAVAMQMKSTFKAIRFGLMVGIGGGVPSAGVDIRLGDVIVSQPSKGHGGVIQYDFGKTLPEKIERTGFLNAPPAFLLSAVSRLSAFHIRGRGRFLEYISKISEQEAFSYEIAREHDGSIEGNFMEAIGCDFAWQAPQIHYGTIASGNQVMKSSKMRDRISAEFGGVLCFEMEAAGLMNNFPSIVIRGVCDYADEYKHKKWQPYAAATAAAYAKDLLMVVPQKELAEARTVDQVINDFRTHRDEPEKPPRLCGINLPRLHPDFVLREALFQDLSAKASPAESRVAIVGLGGLGKTQLAVKYVREQCTLNKNLRILWIHASNEARFDESIHDIVQALHLPQADDVDANTLHLLQQWMIRSCKSEEIVIVLDNVDKADFLFQPLPTPNETMTMKPKIEYFPNLPCSRMLITSRSKHEASRIVHHNSIIEVEPMSLQDADKLLQQGLGEDYNEEHGEELAQALECMPLALSQATAYIRQEAPRMTVPRYLQKLNDDQFAQTPLLQYGGAMPQRDREASNSIFVTWQISFEHIHTTRRSAADLLALMSFCDPQGIPEWLLQSFKEMDETTDGERTSTTAEFDDDISMLTAFSFITYQVDGETLQMHRLVQDSIRWWLTRKQKHDAVRKKYAEYVERNIMEVLVDKDFDILVNLDPDAAASKQRDRDMRSLKLWHALVPHLRTVTPDI